MSRQFAKDQAQGFKNRIEKVAIVGASGSVGKFFVEELLKLGKHKVTAITRDDSSSEMPSGVEVKRVNYGDQSTLVKALQGQDVLIITMGVMAPEDQQSKLIKAAAEAKVPWIFPNEYGDESEDNEVGRDVFIAAKKIAARKEIEDLGVSSWIGFACGFWYEFSLAGFQYRYGFDFKERSVVYVDDGTTPIATSTWPQCGRAMAEVLSLKVLPENEQDKGPCLDDFRNKFVRISSFYISQKQMMESVLRVTGDKPEDWKVSHENHKERYEAGVKEMQSGDMRGFAKLLYTRYFYPDGSADYQKNKGVHNEILGLPKEDLDEYTKIGITMAKEGKVAF